MTGRRVGNCTQPCTRLPNKFDLPGIGRTKLRELQKISAFSTKRIILFENSGRKEAP